MVTTRSLRAEKRTAAKALGGSVLTNKVRFTRLETSEQQPTPVLRELMYTKNRLQHQVENLQDLGITQAAKIKDLTDEIDNYKTLLRNAYAKKDIDIAALESTIANYKSLLQDVEPQYSDAKKDEDNAMLKSVIQDLTRDNEEFDKQSTLLLKEYKKITEEQKALYRAVNTAGQVLAMASRAQKHYSVM